MPALTIRDDVDPGELRRQARGHDGRVGARLIAMRPSRLPSGKSDLTVPEMFSNRGRQGSIVGPEKDQDSLFIKDSPVT